MLCGLGKSKKKKPVSNITAKQGELFRLVHPKSESVCVVQWERKSVIKTLHTPSIDGVVIK